MRIFYIVGKMDQDFGGGVINHRNLELLRATCCDVEVFQFEQYKVPFWQRLKERVHGVNGGVEAEYRRNYYSFEGTSSGFGIYSTFVVWMYCETGER